MGFMDKMKDLVGITDEYDDDYDSISQEEIDAYKKELRGSSAAASAAAAAPEPPLSTGISPLAFSEVAPPQKFTENKEPVDKVSRNDSGAFKMVIIEPKNIDECRKLHIVVVTVLCLVRSANPEVSAELRIDPTD